MEVDKTRKFNHTSVTKLYYDQSYDQPYNEHIYLFKQNYEDFKLNFRYH